MDVSVPHFFLKSRVDGLTSYFLKPTQLVENCTTLQVQVSFRIFQPNPIGLSRRTYGSMQEGWIASIKVGLPLTLFYFNSELTNPFNSLLDWTDASLKTIVLDSLSRPSISVGLGLIYRFSPVRVEVNFGVPLVASKSDGSRKGVQVGMGLEFL